MFVIAKTKYIMPDSSERIMSEMPMIPLTFVRIAAGMKMMDS